MVTDLVPVKVDPNSAGADFWRRYHAFRRARHAETQPDDPIDPDELAERRMKMTRKFDIDLYYEIATGGEMVSWFTGHTVRPGSPGYDKNRDFFDAGWSVIAEHRRRGIGSRWLPVVLDLIDSHGCRVVGIWSEEESGHAFLRWIGAEKRLNAAENRLKLADVDWQMVRRWAEEGPARSPQTRLEIYDGPIPESIIDEFAPQLASLLNTIPFEELDHGEIVITPPQMREWYARMAATDTTQHTVLTRELDGVISGITDVSWTKHRPAFVEQMFTGVRPDARGRGIGKWIKAAMLEKIRRDYPDVEWISTGNAESNAPMLSINHRLGFKQHRAGAEYQISRERLAEKVESLRSP